MERRAIHTPNAPTVGLPLSQAIKIGNLVFTSGMTARDPKGGHFIGGDIEEQTERVLLNLKAILEAAGSSLDKVVKVTVFLTDMRDFDGMNKVYRKFFSEKPPARSTVEVSKLAIDARVEIEMVAGV
jgi:2-iminobutanoate/2-iminopropanoate deaminase